MTRRCTQTWVLEWREEMSAERKVGVSASAPTADGQFQGETACLPETRCAVRSATVTLGGYPFPAHTRSPAGFARTAPSSVRDRRWFAGRRFRLACPRATILSAESSGLARAGSR